LILKYFHVVFVAKIIDKSLCRCAIAWQAMLGQFAANKKSQYVSLNG
jgi:hypothetical protein